MKKIEMVDLKSQYKFIKQEVDEEIKKVIENSTFINGPSVIEFQSELEHYIGVKHVIPCANGTDALQIALMSLNLSPGDEVITSDFTFAATVEVISLLGLTPVLVDVDEVSFNINPNEINKAITSKTKVIIPVHLFGQSANMDEILKIAKKNDLYVIEDNAQGIGSTYTSSNNKTYKTGSMGTLSATSFFPSKNLGAYGDGGAIFTNDDQLANVIRGIVNHGMYKRYYHDVIGVNSRLDSIQASILKVKLKYLNFYNERRKEAAMRYSFILKDVQEIIIPKVVLNCNSHVFHQYTLRIKNQLRDNLVKYLNQKNIPCGIYYPVPLHLQKAYKNSRYIEDNFKVTNKIVNEVISLPMHSELSIDQIEYITNYVLKFFHKFNK
tara:strand:- start:307 stop:1449 length:1143 start_codon:yes stop_codon:yes gene_type:complete